MINDSSEMLGFTLTPTNMSDIDTKSVLQITKDITGKLFGDKGYNQRGITFITKNMKNKSSYQNLDQYGTKVQSPNKLQH